MNDGLVAGAVYHYSTGLGISARRRTDFWKGSGYMVGSRSGVPRVIVRDCVDRKFASISGWRGFCWSGRGGLGWIGSFVSRLKDFLRGGPQGSHPSRHQVSSLFTAKLIYSAVYGVVVFTCSVVHYGRKPMIGLRQSYVSVFVKVRRPNYCPFGVVNVRHRHIHGK